ncbi:MAG TPA: protein BatD [Gammaproteobacteria bacterium]|nr:protein BatD [Gammaproteobacteria bacterium]
MKTKFILVYIISFCAYLFFSTASAADIRVTIDRTQIQLNETFTLTFESSDNVDDDPDFSPLANDFKIINKSTSSNISINNGQYKKISRWIVTLMPTKVGTLTIPAINFGSDQSSPYQVTIKPAQQSSRKKGAAFISELEISTDSAYVQSQIIVIQRLLSSRNINNYEFSPLEISGVDVATEALGDIKQYRTTIGSTPYIVLEKIHAVYPQTSGTLQIKPSLISARIALNNRSSYDPFRSNSKTIRRFSDKKIINVKTIPDSFKGKHWLPAHEVQLVEEFPENTRFKAGEPITRTISLLADGQSASQLPEIHMPETDGLKQYPDKPVLNDNKRDDGITGVQQIKFALIPATEGTYTLPAISIPWWNTETDKMDVAKIPARTFKVDAVTGSSHSTPAVPTATSPGIVTDTTANIQSSVTPSGSAIEQTDSSLLWKIITLLLACAWAVTLLILWKEKRRNKPVEAIIPEARHSLRQAHRQLKSACDKNNAQACKNALLVWGSALFDERTIHSLGKLAQSVDKPLADKINQLNTHLYKQDATDWVCDGLADLCMAFEKNLTHTDVSKNNQQLESLYR